MRLLRRTTPLTGWLARFNPWMWQWGSATRPNYVVYATGLLILGAVLALLRLLSMYAQNYLAAVATIEASNRLRRAIIISKQIMGLSHDRS